MNALARSVEMLAPPGTANTERRAPHRLPSVVANDASVSVNRPIAFRKAMRGTDMNANGSNHKKLESERLAKAVAAALERRVGQGKAMLPKQLAHVLCRSEQTVWGWMAG